MVITCTNRPGRRCGGLSQSRLEPPRRKKLRLLWFCLRASFSTNCEALSAETSSDDFCPSVPGASTAALNEENFVSSAEVISSSSRDFSSHLRNVLAMERKHLTLLGSNVWEGLQSGERISTCRSEMATSLGPQRISLNCFTDKLERLCLNYDPKEMPKVVVGSEVALSDAQLRSLATHRYIRNCVVPDWQRKQSGHTDSSFFEELTEEGTRSWNDFATYFNANLLDRFKHLPRPPAELMLFRTNRAYRRRAVSTPWEQMTYGPNRANIKALNRACVNYMQLVPNAKAHQLFKWLALLWVAVLQRNYRSDAQHLADIEWCTFLLRWKIFRAINPKLPLEQLRQSVQAKELLLQILGVHMGSPALSRSTSPSTQATDLLKSIRLTHVRFQLDTFETRELGKLYRHLSWLEAALTDVVCATHRTPFAATLPARQTACPVQSILQLTYRPLTSQEEQKVIAECAKEVDEASRSLRERFEMDVP